MRRLAAAALLLAAACSSAPSIVDARMKEAEPGDPIEITLTNLDVQAGSLRGTKQFITMDLVVANNSDLDVTVKNISVFQHSVAPLHLDPYSAAPNVVIEPGKEHKFPASLTAQHVEQRSTADVYVASVALRVVVTLENGDAYATMFEIPIRDR